jgi:uncharacterized protein (DUF433 family)
MKSAVAPLKPGTEISIPGIEKTNGVCGGEACIVATRVPVWVLEQAKRLGTSNRELRQDYPSLKATDLAAAWAYVKTHRAEIESAIEENAQA